MWASGFGPVSIEALFAEFEKGSVESTHNFYIKLENFASMKLENSANMVCGDPFVGRCAHHRR